MCERKPTEMPNILWKRIKHLVNIIEDFLHERQFTGIYSKTTSFISVSQASFGWQMSYLANYINESHFH